MMTRFARGAAIVVGLTCGAVLSGYLLHIGTLVDLRPGLLGMAPLSACALILLSAATIVDADRREAACRLGWIVIGVGVAMLLVEGLFGSDILDPYVAGRLFLFNAGRAGSMSPATSLCLVALGVATVARERPRLGDWAGAVALVIAVFALFGYSFGVSDVYALPLFHSMAAPTALSITVLALASLMLRPASGWAAIVASPGPGGVATRRLLAFTPLPPLAALILLDEVEARQLQFGAAMSLLVILTVVPLALLILANGRVLDALEQERRFKAELQRAGDRDLRLIADTLPVLIAFVDKTLTYRFANKTYEDWFYLPSEKVVGQKMPDLLGDAQYAARRDQIEDVLAGREAHFEIAWPHRDGRARDAEIRYIPRVAADGGANGFFIFVSDITDRKIVERHLLATNEALQENVAARTRERDDIWQASKDMLCVASFEGFLLSLNPAWAATLGWSEPALLGVPFIDFVHPDDRADTLEAAKMLSSGQAQLSFENRARHRDGGHRWLSWNAVPRDGLIYASVRDITEAKDNEARRQVLEDQLRQSQKMEAVGQLTGGLAHDFNNLLTGITGSLDLIGTRVRQGRLGDVDRYIAAAQGAAERAAAVTHRLLAFSRRQALEPRPVDVDRLVAGIADLIRRTVGPQVTVEIAGASGLWATLIDPNQLENALLNLCINARDAMPDGGRIAIATANERLEEPTARDYDVPVGDYLVLRVSDTGTGMAPEVIARVFDPFFTTKPLGQGTGLGLSMIYGFVRQSGGQVRISSDVGRGTTMGLYLPRHQGTVVADDVARTVAKPAADGGGETVLVVDDDATVRMLVTEVLEDLGYCALEAADGQAGVKVLRSNVPIDLLVTDVGLPGGIDGRQVADAGRDARPNLKVLFITGFAETAVFGNGHLDPGMRLLTKPFAMDALGGVIKEMIATRPLSRS